MAQTIQHQDQFVGVASSEAKLHTPEKQLWIEKVLGNLEFNRYGIISMLLLWNCCLGGIAVGLGALSHTWQIAALIVPTMAVLTAILAVQPMRIIMNLAGIATVITVIIMLINAF